MAQFTKNNKRNPLERHSSQGLVLGCPICAAKLDLLDTRDGDQAYWCHRCQSGWRAGNLPEAAHRSKDSAIPEPQVEAVTPVVEARVTGKARVANTPQRQKQLAALAPLTRPSGRPLPQGEAKKHAASAPRVEDKLLAAEVIAPKRRAIPRAPVSEPKAVAVKQAAPPKSALPRRGASPRAAEVAVSPRKTVTPKQALNETQKKPLLETSPKNSRRAPQTVTPISEPIKAKRQPLEAMTPRSSRVGVQKQSKETLEIAASAPQPKRTRRPALEIAAPSKTPMPRTKRSAPEAVISGKGSRRPAAPVLKPVPTKNQPLEVKAKPKVSTPRVTVPRVSASQVTAQKPLKKTLETAALIKAPRVKPSRHDKPVLETSKGARKLAQVAAPSPKTATGKRQKLEIAAPKISARAAPQKAQKKILEPAAPIKPSRRKKAVLEIAAAVTPQQPRQRKPTPILEPTPKPRRAARVAAPVKPARAAPEQRTSRNAPISKAQNAKVSQSRAKRLGAPLEPISKSPRATRGTAQPTPAPVKPRTPRVPQPPVAVAPVRPKPARSSPARPAPIAPSNPVQFGLFDALPAKIAPRRSAK